MSSSEVARYYDRNTPRFLLFGRGRTSHAIHRQLWGPGVATAAEASNYVNVLISNAIRDLGLAEPLRILDMGCGVGGTLFHLADQLPDSRFSGITVSRRQYEIAVRLGARKGLDGRCRFVLGDFQTTEIGSDADVAVAVEAFAHSDSRAGFLRAAVRELADRGYLIVVDDFLTPGASFATEESRRRIDEMRRGWRLPSLCGVEQLVRAAEKRGMERVRGRDLSPLIRLGRPRDRVIEWLSPLFQGLGLMGVPFFANMIGGNALQIGLREGFVQYHMVVLRKV